ncbi:anti-sigma factor [Alicyclobacillus sp. SO9]|uniref:anti-sigma factor n=1 Tax=Alicyclobacillus sp. SO9 TaxID=2665646 RepID=UPI0018E7FCCC|nr:anti-sigma factor [Alicyclobacillus sp. SO9]QQE80284.1 anti-sigma factor [Alicyclobacillus sp. SO9]
MNHNHEDRFEAELRHLKEIPFPKELQDRILREARQINRVPERSLRWRRNWTPWLAGVGGVGTAAALLVGVIGHRTHPTEQKLSTSGKGAAYNLQKSKLHVLNVQIGTIPGEPKDSSVKATIENTGTQTLNRSDVFGVLAFPRSVAQKSLLNSDSLTFVNGPQQPLAPGHTAKWTFHPVGAPHDARTNGLTEQPYLVFYRTGLKKVAGGESAQPVGTNVSTLWKTSGLKIEQTSVKIRNRGNTAQSFTVDTKVKNVTKRKVNVTNLWGVVWFNQNPPNKAPIKDSWDWSAPGATRFITSPRTNGKQYIAPGQTLEVYFDLVGSSKSDFLHRTPHVAIIQR